MLENLIIYISREGEAKVRRMLQIAVLGSIVLFPVMAYSMAVAVPVELTANVSSSLGSASYTVSPDDWTYEEYVEEGKTHKLWYFDLNSEVVLQNGSNEVIGRIKSLSLSADADPSVALGFVCWAGAENTSFSFTMGLSSLNVVNPDAKATASITATDLDNDGVILTGSYGGKCYQARYNSPSAVFTSLVDDGSASGGESYSDNESDGWRTIGATVTSIESEYYFTLSSQDSASGTSNFQIVPEPSIMSLLVFGIWGLIRRK